MALKQEFDEQTGDHRLVDHETGQATAWASYNQVTMLNGMVGHTAYYGPGTEGITTPEEFVRWMAVGEPKAKAG